MFSLQICELVCLNAFCVRVRINAYPIPVPAGAEPKTVSYVGGDGLVTTKTTGLGNPEGTPVYVGPVTGSLITGKADNTLTISAAAGNRPGVVATPTALNCSGIYDMGSLYALAQADPARAATCIQLAQFGCPSAGQLQMFDYYGSTSPGKPPPGGPGDKPGGAGGGGKPAHGGFDIWAGKFKQWVQGHA